MTIVNYDLDKLENVSRCETDKLIVTMASNDNRLSRWKMDMDGQNIQPQLT